jgi:hypothetical protein
MRAYRAQIPAAWRGTDVASAPLLAGLTPAAAQVDIGAPDWPVTLTAGGDRLQRQQSRACHPPDDLLLITDPGRKGVREHQQTPERGSIAGTLDLGKERVVVSNRRWRTASCAAKLAATRRRSWRARSRAPGRMAGTSAARARRQCARQDHGKHSRGRPAAHTPIVRPAGQPAAVADPLTAAEAGGGTNRPDTLRW